MEDLRGQLVSFEYDSNSQRDFAVVLSGQEVTVEEVMRKAQHTQRQVGRSALFPCLVSFLLKLGEGSLILGPLGNQPDARQLHTNRSRYFQLEIAQLIEVSSWMWDS